MSDADVNEADIEQYKVEVKDSDDPVAVSSRWVDIERKDRLALSNLALPLGRVKRARRDATT
jgi:hypothetical protein